MEIVDYKPPLAVMVLLDGSGSMQSVQGADGTTKFEGAKQGIVSALGAFSGRDYVGLMTLSETYDTVLPLTSAAQSEMIGKAVADAAPSGAATLFSGALAAAGQALAAETRVSKRHIVLITDGRPAEGDYLAEAERLYRDYGITLSVFGIGTSGSEEASLQELAEVGGGRFYAVADAAALGGEMVNELRSPELTEVEYTPFYPVACDLLSPLFDGVALGAEGNGQAMPFTLDYFYGTSLKDSSEAVLVGDYDVPVYAQWTFGKGRVGSFLCDLGDFWPTGFTADENGEKFLLNAVGYLTGAGKGRIKRPFGARRYLHDRFERHTENGSRALRRDGGGAEAPAGEHRADRQRKHRFARGARRGGVTPYQQICRGAARQTVLRWLRICGRRGEPRAGPLEKAVRLRPLQRPAPFGRPGEFRGVLCHAGTGRYDHGHESLARRTPHARFARQYFGKIFQGGPLRRFARNGADRLRRDGAHREKMPSENDRFGRQRLSPASSILRASAKSATRWART